MSKTPIALKPVAGFCVKSSTTQPAVFSPNPPQNGVLEPTTPIAIPIGFKVFANIAWDPNVPPPPQGSEEVIHRAMQGQDVDEGNSDGWYVPVVVSNGRQDKDKELALQRIEAQTSLSLSRQIGTPNITSKGKLLPRTVYIPSFLVNQGLSPSVPPAQTAAKPLIQEVTPATSSAAGGKPKGILKAASSPSTNQQESKVQHSRPTWSWSKDGAKIEIKIQVPNLPRALIENATLDIEPRRFMVNIPDRPILDVDLSLSDAEIVATAASPTSATLHEGNGGEPNNTLTLKRQRPFDVDGATSEWRVVENVLVILA
ncbi:hypothetical protein H0H87_003364 [Tephrocybe sp. NHM501043]|nr:hypothetical protein H0H87_003364 [Tephrocybe sp. NHM501043]